MWPRHRLQVPNIGDIWAALFPWLWWSSLSLNYVVPKPSSRNLGLSWARGLRDKQKKPLPEFKVHSTSTVHTNESIFQHITIYYL